LGQVLLLTAPMMFLRPAASANPNWGPTGSGTPAGGTGNWNITDLSWATPSATTYQAWSNSNNDTAYFGGTGGTITLTSNVTSNGFTFDADGYTLAATGGSTLTIQNTSGFPALLSVENAGQTAIFNAPLAFASDIMKGGLGTMTIAGASTITGIPNNFTINSGTVKLMGATGSMSSSTRLGFGAATDIPSSGIHGGGGTFIYDNTGATGATTQSLSVVYGDAGDGTVQTNRVAAQNVALTFDFFNGRSTGSTLNFVTNGGVNGTENKIVLSNQGAGSFGTAVVGIFFGGNNYAWYDAGGFVRAMNYGVDAGTSTTAGTTSVTGTHVKTTGAVTAQNTATLTTLNLAGTSTTAGANNLTLNSGQTLTVNGILRSGNTSGSSATISGGTAIRAASGRELVIRTDGVNDTLTINSVIAANGSNALTKSGAGTLFLGGTNTYTGKTFVDGGVLSIAAMANLGSPAAANTVIQLQQGTLQYTGATASTTRGFTVGYGGGGIDVTQAGTSLTFTGRAYGPETLLPSDALIKKGAGTLVLGGTADNQDFGVVINNGTLQLAKTSTADVHAVNAPLALVVNNGGKVQLAGSGGDQINDLSDVTVNTGGTFDLNGKTEAWDGLSGTGGTVTNNSASGTVTLTLGSNNNAFSATRGVFSGAITDGVNGAKIALVKTGTGTQILAGANTHTGGTTINSGTLQIGQGGTSGSISGNITNNGALVFKRSDASSYTGNLSGSGTLTQAGTGTLTLSGANSASGVTKINAGTLQFAKQTALYNNVTSNWTATKITVANGATLGLNVGGTGEFTAADVTALAALGTATGGFQSGSTLALDTTNASGSNFSYSGGIANPNGGSNTLHLVKNGANTLTLTGTNLYTGTTKVNAGTLLVSATGSINGTSRTTINAGGTLNYSSSTALTSATTINGGTFAYNGPTSYATSNLTFNSGILKGVSSITGDLGLHSTTQILSPGNSPGLQNFIGNQNWSAYTYQWEINNFTGTTAGTDFDQLQITGALNLNNPGGTYILDVTSLNSGNAPGDVANFSNTTQSWVILTASNGITNFNSNEWTIDLSNFSSTPVSTGTWSLSISGPGNQNLVLTHAAIPEPSSFALFLMGMGLMLLAFRRPYISSTPPLVIIPKSK
jgi:autotransporter-associated beta strand protein